LPTRRKPAVVLLSGGLDSSTLVHWVVREVQPDPLLCLSFDYGQRHARELDCARVQAALAGAVEHVVLDLKFLGAMLAPGTTLVAAGANVPALSDIAESELVQPPTYVPNRNMMLLSMAAAFAEARGAASVYYGAQAQDEYGYWDCTAEFVNSINTLLSLNRKTPVRIEAPFTVKRKAEVVRLGRELGVDFASTWTCYRGGERPCGVCPACVERAKAFAEAGVVDPLV